MRIDSVGVFCGFQRGDGDRFVEPTRAFAEELARRGIALVYGGGGGNGLMGVLADAGIAAGGRVIGVIPRVLHERGEAHADLTECVVVDDLPGRKAGIIERSDAFVALPGGFGTLDELMEVLTLGQLGLHGKPCGVLNVDGYFNGLLAFIDGAVRQGFIAPANRRRLLVDTTAAGMLRQMRRYGTVL